MCYHITGRILKSIPKIALLSFIIFSCKKETENKEQPVVITTLEVKDIDYYSATCGGNITSDGGNRVLYRGVCWSTNKNPTNNGTKTVDGSGIGSFVSSMKDLTDGTIYYVRAYAITYKGVSYGNEFSFTTKKVLSLPEVTNKFVDKSDTTASLNGTITYNGGTDIIAQGFCWSDVQSPTIYDYKTVEPIGSTDFISVIRGLQYNKKYYFRAYATNSVGTGYGDIISFVFIHSPVFNTSLTYGEVKDIEKNSYKTITIGNQVWMAENLRTTTYNDGTPIPLISKTFDHYPPQFYSWYNYDKVSYGSIYGALYNWPVICSGKLCPVGWHVPDTAEWSELIQFLGGEEIAGGKLKEADSTHWKSPNLGADNSSGFTALPAGLIEDNISKSLNIVTYIAVALGKENDLPYNKHLYYKLNKISISMYDRYSDNVSVRCISDK